MAEVANAGDDECQAGCVGGGDGIGVADGPAHYRRRDNPHVHWVVSLPAVEVKPEDK